MENFIDKVERMQRESKSVVIAVSEGVKLEDGRYVCELSDDAHFVDAFGHKSLTGTARYLANQVAGKLQDQDALHRAVHAPALRGARLQPHGHHRGLSGRRRGGKGGV